MSDETNRVKLEITLTSEELKSLDTLLWQEEKRLEMRASDLGPSGKVRSQVVTRMRSAITYAPR